MDYNLSLKFYKVFYKNALVGRELANQTSPKLINKVEELQQICRVCGCMDDDTFVALDAYHQFEFEPSICSYRILLQRSSLQFQFNTMPDLPQRICARCAYKAKIFYLMTRQFVLGQNTMRATVTKWYRDKYNVEPPELPEDRKQLKKQLVALSSELPSTTAPPTAGTAAEQMRRQQFQSITYATKKPLTSVNELIKACVGPKRKQLKRSISAETCLDEGTLDEGTLVADTRTNTAIAQNTSRHMHFKSCRTARSTVNLNLKQNANGFTLKKGTPRGTAGGNQSVNQFRSTTARGERATDAGRTSRGNVAKATTVAARSTKSIDGTQTADAATAGKMMGRTASGTARAARGEQPKTPQATAAREHLSRGKLSGNRECFVTPRVSPTRMPKATADSPRQLANQERVDMPLSKAQLQRRLQERRKQWR